MKFRATCINSIDRRLPRNYSGLGMERVEGTPWRPRRLDELLDEPFEKLEERRAAHALTKLDELYRRLTEIEAELDVMVECPSCPQ